MSCIVPLKVSRSITSRAAPSLRKTLQNGEPYLILCQQIDHGALIGARKLRKYGHKAPDRKADSGRVAEAESIQRPIPGWRTRRYPTSHACPTLTSFAPS